MNDLDAPAEGRRRGRRPKRDKRVLLSLRMEPELRARIVTIAEKTGRSISQETEALLQRAVNGRDRGAPLASVKKLQDNRQPDEDGYSLLCEALELSFGPQIGALLFMIGHAMFFAQFEGIAWSRDVVERTRRFPAVKRGTVTTLQQLAELGDFLIQSSPSHAGEQSWLDDPYVYGQVADAARSVLEAIAPEGDTSAPPLPRGINRGSALSQMMNSGKNNAHQTMHNFVADEPPPRWLAEKLGRGDVARLRHWLGDAIIARLRQKFSKGYWALPSWVWAEGPFIRRGLSEPEPPTE